MDAVCMVKYLARVLRALAVTCLGAGGGVGLMVFIVMLIHHSDTRNFQFAFTFGLYIGVIVASLLGAIFLLLDLTSRLFLAKGLYDDIWKLEQVREIATEGTAKEIVSACRQALLAVPYVKAVTDDVEHLITRATIGQSWRSSGEDMEVEINPSGERSWTLRCTSKPHAPDTVFDYGKNFENVQVWQHEVVTILTPKTSHVTNHQQK
jgi:hypothetical protein